METKQNDQSNNKVAKTGDDLLKNATTMDFNELFNQDDKELDKSIKFTQNRKGKQVQLLARINSIQMQQSTAQIEYRKSLVNPIKDSVGLAIEIKALGEELKIAEAVYAQLFPEMVIGASSNGNATATDNPK